MCKTLVDALQNLNDPRLAVWAEPIDIQIVLDSTLEDGTDEIVNGVRRVARDIVNTYQENLGFPLDSDPKYVGLPPAWSIVPQAYNLNPNLEQGPHNPHASHLNDIYQSPSGPLLKSRLLSAAEVHFILAEAAQKGWSVGGSAEDQYNSALEASFNTWGVGGELSNYLSGNAAYDGTLAQILSKNGLPVGLLLQKPGLTIEGQGYRH